MLLRFVAREDHIATVPGAPIALGQVIPRVGRHFVPAKDGAPPSMPALPDPVEIDTEKESLAIVEAYKRLAKVGDIFCLDEPTARACDAPFVPVHFDSGAWVPDPPPAKPEPDSSTEPVVPAPAAETALPPAEAIADPAAPEEEPTNPSGRKSSKKERTEP